MSTVEEYLRMSSGYKRVQGTDYERICNTVKQLVPNAEETVAMASRHSSTRAIKIPGKAQQI
jgi:hypothetical protein